MKKNYFTSILILVLGLFFSYQASAQLHANDDYATVANGTATSVVLSNILANDTYNNLPVTLSNVTITQASSTSENFYISNGDVVFHNGPVPMGTYAVDYFLNLQLPPFTMSNYARIFLTVACPTIPPPTAVVTQPTCANPTVATVTFSGLEAGMTVVYSLNGGPMLTLVAGGPNVTLQVQVPPGGQNVLVYQSSTGSCSSVPQTALINSASGIAFDISAAYVDFNANGYTDVGDVVNYTYAVTNLSCNDLTNITVSSNASLTVLGGPLPILAAGATDSTTFTSIYAITQADINNGYVTKSAVVTGVVNAVTIANDAIETLQLAINDGIKLVAFIDTNSNGVKDAGESIFDEPGNNFNYEINNNGTVHHISNSLPAHYIFESNPANSYDLSFTFNSQYAAYYTAVPAAYNDITIAAGSGITTYYFAVTEIPFVDVFASIYAIPPRPGFTRNVSVYYGSDGNQAVASGTLTFVKNDLETIININTPGTIPTANGFTYNFTNLQPNQDHAIIVTLQTPTIPTIALGDLLSLTASITTPPGDIHANNNSYTLTQAVVGSYDPNEKYESHGGKVLFSSFTADDYFTYTITFENTGTANAINVSVNDILDSQLDETTVRMVDASHQYTLERIANHLTWKFNGIDLPPSTPNTATGPGHGYVTFQVKPKAGFALNDVIPNTADIYFDFNPAIVTNTNTTQFVPTLATNSFAFDNFKYYPNPVKNIFTVSNTSVIDNVVVTSVLGQQVLAKSVSGLKAELDLSSLANGVYFVKVTSQKQSKTIKIIKE
jgi:uncharacterized repeat protein (TIGR01451 family)